MIKLLLLLLIKKKDDEFPIIDKRSRSKKSMHFIKRKLTKTQQLGMLTLSRIGQSESNKKYIHRVG